MKLKYVVFLFVSVFLMGCGSDDNSAPADTPNLPAQTLMAVAYGDDPEQLMDVYLPENRTSQTKVVVLVHGGYWTEGSRSDMSYFIAPIQSSFPGYAIVNLDYRLATETSPGFPKQIEDIGLALDFLESAGYQISDDYGFIGTSAGGHLSMLYAYDFDDDGDVKVICNIVGPADFTDPSYVENPLFQTGLVPLVGNVAYADNPQLFQDVSPALQISADAPATISFYGGQDPLIPVSQGQRLTAKLNEFNVTNSYNLYPDGGHGDWDFATIADVQIKLTAFFQQHF